MTDRKPTTAEQLDVIERLGVNPENVLWNSVRVHRHESGKPYLVTYTVAVLEGLDALDGESDD